jgi:hypothetical protein
MSTRCCSGSVRVRGRDRGWDRNLAPRGVVRGEQTSSTGPTRLAETQDLRIPIPCRPSAGLWSAPGANYDVQVARSRATAPSPGHTSAALAGDSVAPGVRDVPRLGLPARPGERLDRAAGFGVVLAGQGLAGVVGAYRPREKGPVTNNSSGPPLSVSQASASFRLQRAHLTGPTDAGLALPFGAGRIPRPRCGRSN